VARILVSALEKTEIGGALGTFEAGTGRRTTVNDIAQFVRDEVTLQGGPFADITHLPMRPGEGERSIVIGDPTTLELLNVGDLRPLEEGVKDTVAYFSDYLASR
jgi:nucleoside-diphosphate-sugar epimerase